MENGFTTQRLTLGDGRTAVPVYHYRKLDSTNAEAKRRGVADIAVILADGQTAGRGRLGRQFFSEGGIYLSILLPAEALLYSPMLLTSAAAVAVCEAVREIGFDAEIKWVNDILVDGRKVCGILAEAVSEGDNISGYIVGIGINIGTPDFPKELSEIAGALPLSEKGKRTLTEAVLRGFFAALTKAPADILSYCTAHSAVLGKRVRFFGAKEGVGQAVRLSEDGGLAVMTDGGDTVILTGGEISLRMD